jgi:hypothetical protein
MGRLKTGSIIDRERLGSGGSCSGKSETEARQRGQLQRQIGDGSSAAGVENWRKARR